MTMIVPAASRISGWQIFEDQYRLHAGRA